MPEQVQKILNNIREFFTTLDTTKKLILGGVALTVLVAIGILSTISLQKNRVVLFKDLTSKDFAEVTKKLDSLGYQYGSSDTSVITVDPEQRQEIVTKLAQENLIPAGVQGWELFNVDKFTETQFDKDIKKYRALKGAIEQSLMTLRSVDKAYVNIAFPEDELFSSNSSPVKASVILHYIPGVESLSRKEVKGIVNLVSRAVPKLKPENVSVADADGKIISDFEEDLEKERLELRIVQEKLRIGEEQRIQRLIDMRNTLRWLLGGEDRVDITRFEYNLNWDKESYKDNSVSPVVAIPDNPNTPYSELKLVDGYSLKVSSKETKEDFKGRGFTPDGPAGTEPNIPPGYKDTDYQKSEYSKSENINNYEFNRRVSEVQKQPWKVEKVNLSVVIDGMWEKKEKEDGTGYDRKYVPVSEDELRQIRKNLESAVGIDKARGDQISVITIPKDRSSQFAAEDEELRKQKAIRQMIIASLIIILLLIVSILVYRAVKKEIARRRRLREEELAAQQQMMREAALRVMDEGGAEVELSLDEKYRRELLENAINLAREKPEEVAQLLRTWLSEEEAG
ncbi:MULTISPECIES: flagellar basal-body MS-ring/collar protein FliF [Leptospira]|uniref:Flagellar M-ring protein n=2 Tax=Leptospira weilii TaxID=28184 RepID=A0A828Z6H1_9LEPT|nr:MULTISPECIES: flagellar basal-body MS-ring/collar protein FliF [Leptospira]EKR65495.1 flagellar M-ring protein FliF [Leptospira weilii str. 2006001853]EMJ61147.1 flagellar M-ring protein FliF [Leptospira sp. P2653]EMN44697.1 flagellar M-ring protein FliF [Leptospira weilii str. LNT 1234]MCL8268345.1 flagellar M-ring protein FliF [Leptospira weilii]MDL5244505.1 flagellar basal-body MS-ring/collar protein FliF [Leptospira weilii]